MLAWPALWNGYPLVFADSGTYLGQAIQRYLGWDRPPFYSFHAYLLHWNVTLWAVPVAQGLIAAHLLALSLRVLDRPGPGPLLGCALLLAGASGLPWIVAQIMPDVFSGLLVLAHWLLGFGWQRLGPGERLYLVLLATAAAAFHLSHLPLAAGLAVLGLALGWLRLGPMGGLRAAGRMALPLGLALPLVAGVNLAGHGRLAVSPFGSVFLAARLIADGPAARTIAARCEAGEAWRVCALDDRLPMPENDFLWPPDGPLRAQLGGGKAWAGEASSIVAATLATDPAGVALAVAGNALRQFGMMRTGHGLEPWPAAPGPAPLIEAYFPAREGIAYRASRQSTGKLEADVASLVPLHLAFAWLGLALLPGIAWFHRRELPVLALCVLLLGAAVGNAVVTGGLSGPSQRYQGRIAWLFLFAPAAVLAGEGVVRRRRPVIAGD